MPLSFRRGSLLLMFAWLAVQTCEDSSLPPEAKVLDGDLCEKIRVVQLNNDHLFFRSKPGKNGKSIRMIKEGEILFLKDVFQPDPKEDTYLIVDPKLNKQSWIWLEVSDGKVTGWISALYGECYNEGPAVEPEPKPEPTPTPDPVPEPEPTPTPDPVPVPTPTPDPESTPDDLCTGPITTWPVPSLPPDTWWKDGGQKFGVCVGYMECGFHTGIDIVGKTGTPIVAAGTGKVIYIGDLFFNTPGSGRGKYAIVINHGSGIFSTYSHNNAAHVQVGQCVQAGDPIADIGSLGKSSEPHLHFEVLWQEEFLGPDYWDHPWGSVIDPKTKRREYCKNYLDPLLFYMRSNSYHEDICPHVVAPTDDALLNLGKTAE